MRIRKLLIVLVILIFVRSIANALPIENEMKNFMINTLRNNFGNKSDVELVASFFSEYLKNNGKVELKIDGHKLDSINKYLFQDSVFFKYYPLLVFVPQDQEFENELDNHFPPKIIFEGDRNQTLPKTGIYINFNYLTQIKEGNGNDAVNKIFEYNRYTGFVSYFTVADSFLKCSTCVDDSLEFIAVLYWKYFCDIGGYDFYKKK